MIQKNSNFITDSSAERGVQFKVDSDLGHLFEVLRSGLYSNRIEAVTREYITNAYDAHIVHGTEDVPILIQLPGYQYNDFVVRDFGPGMSEKDIYDVFATYAKSTKRNSNVLNGTFGFGCKSAFAYSDVFTVISYHQGRKYTFNAYLDSTNVGKIELVNDVVDQESKSGLEIRIPVSRSGDFYAFEKGVYRVAVWLKTQPIITRDMQEFKSNPKLEVVHSNQYGTLYSNDSSNYYNLEAINVVMGNVCYRVGSVLRSLQSRFDSRWALVLHAPNGALSYPPSRETINQNEENISWLDNQADKFFQQWSDDFQAEIDLKDSPIEALRLIESQSYFKLICLLKKDFRMHHLYKYRGRDYTLSSFENLMFYGDHKYHKSMTPSVKSLLSDRTTYVYSDGGFPERQTKARWEFIKSNAPGACYLVHGKTEGSLDDFIKHPIAQGLNFIPLSSVPADKLPKRKPHTKREKHIYKLTAPATRSPYSSMWEEATIDNNNKLFVYIDKFAPVLDTFKSHGNPKTLLNRLTSFVNSYNLYARHKNIPEIELYGVKKNDTKLVSEKWTHINDFIEKFQVDLINEPGYRQHVVHAEAAKQVDVYSVLTKMVQSNFSTMLLEKSNCELLTKIYDLWPEKKSGSSDDTIYNLVYSCLSSISVFKGAKIERSNIVNDIVTDLNKQKTDYDKAVDQWYKKYPMMHYLKYASTPIDQHFIEHVIQYMSLVG